MTFDERADLIALEDRVDRLERKLQMLAEDICRGIDSAVEKTMMAQRSQAEMLEMTRQLGREIQQLRDVLRGGHVH